MLSILSNTEEDIKSDFELTGLKPHFRTKAAKNSVLLSRYVLVDKPQVSTKVVS